MDEPCSSLDPISSRVVEDTIELRENHTIVIAPHKLAQAKRISNFCSVFWVEDNIGKFIEYNSTELIFHALEHAMTAAYIHGISG